MSRNNALAIHRNNNDSYELRDFPSIDDGNQFNLLTNEISAEEVLERAHNLMHVGGYEYLIIIGDFPELDQDE